MERIYHIRARRSGFAEVQNNGGATVQLRNVEGDPLRLQMRVAYCNPSDVFNKKLGKAHCEGRGAVEREFTRHNKDTGESYSHLVIDPAIPPKDWHSIPIRSLPAELGRVWRNVHKRMGIKPVPGMHPNFDNRLREWLPKE